jgi:uncharacterized protein YdeI (YjbR/CyaY-like superfamily)
MNAMNPKVDFYFNKAEKWQEEFKKLRMVILACQLTEELKWGVPCYTVRGRAIWWSKAEINCDMRRKKSGLRKRSPFLLVGNDS